MGQRRQRGLQRFTSGLIAAGQAMDGGSFRLTNPVLTLDLLDDATGNTVIGYDSAGATAGATANEPVITASATTPTGPIGSGNYIDAAFATSADSYVEIVMASDVDLRSYDYLGFWIYSDTAFIGTDYNVKIYDALGTLLQTTFLQAVDVTVWQRAEVSISGIERSRIKKIRITDLVGDNDILGLQNLIAYKYGNGRGPVYGAECSWLRASGTLTMGMGVCNDVALETFSEAADNSQLTAGICLVGAAAGADALVMTRGECYLRVLGTSVVTGDNVAATGTSKVFDDDATAGRSMGKWRQTAAATLQDIKALIGV